MSIVETLGIVIIIIAFIYILYYIYDLFFGDSQLKCIVSDINGETYCIRERSKMKEKQAVDLLARVVEKGQRFVDYLIRKYPDEDFAKRLKENYNKKKISEILPNSTMSTAYTENKEKISLCLNKKRDDNNDLIDENLLMFVLLHELAHMAFDGLQHPPQYWDLFKRILKESEECGVYKNEDYKKNKKDYCSINNYEKLYLSKH